MITLNLETKTPEHEALKQYLEENANEFLAKKINDGVRIEKDGKTLINKKTLETFMDYAHEEAKKLAAKGAKYSVIKDDIVSGWAMHYFEENDIIGTLYNEDGTEYKAAPKTTKISNKPTPAPIVSPKPAKPKPQQFNLFDIMENAEKSPSDEPMKETIEKNVTEMDDDNDGEFETPVPEDIDDGDEEPTELRVDENGEILPQTTTEKQNGNSLYQQYLSVQKQYPHAVIAYRLGDFYEIFGDIAIIIAKELELTITSRDCGLPQRIPMVAFPFHISEKYFTQLRRRHKLVVMENGNATVLEKQPLESTPRKTVEPPKEEPKPTPVSVVPETTDDIEEMKAQSKYFDKDAMCVLLELFDYEIDVQ